MPRGLYFFLFPIIIGGCLVFYMAGLKQGRQQHALEETKILSHALLERGGQELSGQFEEYAKGRIYWNGYVHLSSSYAEGLVKDFGPVKASKLGRADYRKEPADHETIRTKALEKISDQ